MADKIKHILIVFVLPTKLYLSIKKHAVHNIHRLAWASMPMGAPGNCPVCPCVKTALGSSPGRVKPKIIKLVCAASPLIMQY